MFGWGEEEVWTKISVQHIKQTQGINASIDFGLTNLLAFFPRNVKIKTKSSSQNNVYVKFVRFNLKVSHGRHVGTDLGGGGYIISHHSHFGGTKKYVLIKKIK